MTTLLLVVTIVLIFYEVFCGVNAEWIMDEEDKFKMWRSTADVLYLYWIIHTFFIDWKLALCMVILSFHEKNSTSWQMLDSAISVVILNVVMDQILRL